MKYILIIFLFIGLNMKVFSQSEEAFPNDKIDELAYKYVHKKSNKALVIGIIKDGKKMIGSFGQLSKKDTRRPDENTIFEIGAMTGVFTTSLMVYQSRAGIFELTDPINQFISENFYFPDYRPIKCVVLEETNKTPIYDPEEIYPREYACYPDYSVAPTCVGFCDLATHTSGLPNNPKGMFSWNPLMIGKQKTKSHKKISKKDFYSSLYRYELTIPPGIKFQYSNVGMALLGNVLSEVSGKDYSTLLEEIITNPLNLDDTRIVLKETQQSRLAPGHKRSGRSTANWELEAMAPAAGLKSSTKDLLSFLEKNINAQKGDLEEAFLQTHQSRYVVKQKDLKHNNFIGYGWITTVLEGTNEPIVWINGGTGGYRSFMAFNMDSKTGVVILSNSANNVDEIGFDIMKMLYARSPEKKNKVSN